MESHFSLSHESIEVKIPSGYKFICPKDILYIEALKKISIVYFSCGDSLITYHLLKWYEKKLPQPFFFRCHNSYIINCQFIEFYCHHLITLKSRDKIPLSRNSKLIFKENLKQLYTEL
jgi:DNA-binding LytR/AlgR family response regulator